MDKKTRQKGATKKQKLGQSLDIYTQIKKHCLLQPDHTKVQQCSSFIICRRELHIHLLDKLSSQAFNFRLHLLDLVQVFLALKLLQQAFREESMEQEPGYEKKNVLDTGMVSFFEEILETNRDQRGKLTPRFPFILWHPKKIGYPLGGSTQIFPVLLSNRQLGGQILHRLQSLQDLLLIPTSQTNISMARNFKLNTSTTLDCKHDRQEGIYKPRSGVHGPSAQTKQPGST